MDSPTGLRLWDALHSVHATLPSHEIIGALTLYLQDGITESTLVEGAATRQCGFPTLLMCDSFVCTKDRHCSFFASGN